MSKPVPFWCFWDPRSGIEGGLVFGLILTGLFYGGVWLLT